MSELHSASTVRVHPFTRQQSSPETEIVIGHPERGVFFALPPEAVEILDLLSSGKSVAAAREHFVAKYSENPDIEDLLDHLRERGFVSWGNETGETTSQGPPQNDLIRYHFVGFPKSLSRAMFSKPALITCGALIGVAVLLLVLEPTILPGRESLFRDHQITLMLSAIVAIGLISTFLHEMAHLIAAQARGVSSRLGVGNRLWMLVAETDMTGVWSIPKSQRYLPLLAGPLLDLVSASLIVVLLFSHHHHLISFSHAAQKLVRASLFIYLLRLAWQCCFFVRTDFYYVFATYFDCKNLMNDVEDLLKKKLADFLGKPSKIEQGHISLREMRAIKSYSWLWLGGRLLAISLLFTVTIPLCVQYSRTIWQHLDATEIPRSDNATDSLLLSGIILLFTLTGLSLWIRGLWRSGRPLK